MDVLERGTPPMAKRLERALAALLLVSSLLVVFRYTAFMATTSLWNDEIYSVVMFAGQGPVRAMTDYHVPNNHVFFNLASSLMPGRGSVAPLRARGLSFVALYAALAAGFFLLLYLTDAWTGAVFVSLLALNREILDIALQARGYGLTLLFATLVSVAVCRRWWSLLTVATVLGTYTLPTFGLFSAAVFLVLILTEGRAADGGVPERPRLAKAALAAGAIGFVLYLPILAPLASSARTYAQSWGESYSSWRSIGETVRLFVISPDLFCGPLPASVAIALFLALTIAAVRKGGSSRALALSSVLFLVLCLLLRTPQVRTTLFVAPPLLVAALLCLPSAFSKVPARAAISALLLVTATRLLRQPEPFPFEDWASIGRFIEATFPARVPVRGYWPIVCLKPYVSPDRRVEMEVDATAFASGDAIALGFDPNRQVAFTPGEAETLVTVRFPQRRGSQQTVVFHPPVNRFGTREGDRFLLQPPGRYRSLVIRRREGEPLVIPLGDRFLEFVPVPNPDPVVDAWAYPSR